jgi:hypothetical protein
LKILQEHNETGSIHIEKNALLSDGYQIYARILQHLGREEESKHHFILSHTIDPEK